MRYLSAHSQPNPQRQPLEERGRTMSENQTIENIANDVELERYELFAKPSHLFNLQIDRRDFFKLLGGGLVLVFAIDALAQEGRQGGESGGRRGQATTTPKEIGG